MVVNKNRKMSREERLREAVIWEIQGATSSSRDRLKQTRKAYLDYYYCNPRGDEVEGFSQVISPDCRAMVDQQVAQLVDMISHDSLCEFQADGPDEEAQVQLESKLCNAIVQQHNDGPTELQNSIWDALVFGDGVAKFYAVESEEVEERSYEDLEQDEKLAMLVPEEPNVFHEMISDEDGTSVFRTTISDVSFMFKSVPAERFLYPLNHDRCGLDEVHFCAEEMTETRSELVQRGYSKSVVYDLPAAELDTNETSRKRNRGKTSYNSRATEDQEEIEIHECFIRIDLDRSGEAQLYRVFLANKDVVLEYEPVLYVPYVLGNALLNGQRLGGQSLVDILMPVQDIKTALERQHLNNIYSAVNNRVVYDPKRADEEAVLNPMAGGGISSRDPANAVVPLPFQDVGPSIELGRINADKMRTELGGAALDMATADAQLIGETAHGIERQMGNRELHIAMMARNLAETLLNPLFKLVHRTVRDYSTKPFKMEVKGEWQEIDPQTWPERTRVSITTGDSMGVKRMKAQALMQVIALQQQAMAAGMSGVLADTTTTYRAVRDYMRLVGFDNPGRYVINPETPQAQQAAQANAQSAQQQQQQIDRLATMQAQLEQMKLQVEKQNNEQELQFKYAELEAKMEMKEAELVGGATLEMQKQRKEISAQSERSNGTGSATTESADAGNNEGAIQ